MEKRDWKVFWDNYRYGFGKGLDLVFMILGMLFVLGVIIGWVEVVV